MSSFLPLKDIGAFGIRWMWRGIVLALFSEKGLDLVAKIAGCRLFWCQLGPRPDWKLGSGVNFPFRKNESSVTAKLHHTSIMGRPRSKWIWGVLESPPNFLHWRTRYQVYLYPSMKRFSTRIPRAH